MINTIRYLGQREVIKEGKKLTVQAKAQDVLALTGAFIQVTITHPLIIQENMKQQGKTAPTANIKALIDTGASGTVITPRVSEQLGLIHTGY